MKSAHDSNPLEDRGFFRAWFEEGLRILFKGYFKVFHRVHLEGAENIPTHFSKLIVVSNHASLLDGPLLWTYLKLPFKIIVDRTVARKLLFRPFVQNRHIVLIDSMNPYSLKEVIRLVGEGTPLLVFPEGRRTSTGSLMKFYDGTGFVVYHTGAAILPIHIKNSYATFFARKHKGRRLFAKIGLTIGTVHESLFLDHLSIKKRKKAATRCIYDLLCETFLLAHNKPTTLGREFIRCCRRNGRSPLFSDSTGAQASYRQTLVSGFALGRYLSRRAAGNIGLLLPNLNITAMIFFGLQLFRKSPAFLNYAGGPAALAQAMDLADLRVIITSRQFLERVGFSEETFGDRRILYLEDLKKNLGLKDRLSGFFRAKMPASFQMVRPHEPGQTAVILFTSGSEGRPKGVCLSHENLMTNAYQGLARVDIGPSDIFLNVLPLFHSFGLTVGTIIPLLAGASVVFHISPLHYRIVPELAYDRGCTILLATNTFLNGYERKADAYDFYSMRYVFCGAEPLSDAVFERFMKRFGLRVMSGYGATECSPIIALNSALQYAYGTVGRILPGLEHRLVKVEGLDDKGGSVGRLLLRGKNVMQGYLSKEPTPSPQRRSGPTPVHPDWYDTGDIVELDDEGYLRILGRMKRFAKISGEMISLTAVEEVLTRNLAGRKDLAVLSVEDERRGESLIVVTNAPKMDLKAVRTVLKNSGFSELTMPKRILFRHDLPKLGTGKIDYIRLKELIGPPLKEVGFNPPQ